MHKAKQDFEHAVAQGIEQGMEQGEAKGRHEEALKIAREMIKDRFPIEKIKAHQTFNGRNTVAIAIKTTINIDGGR